MTARMLRIVPALAAALLLAACGQGTGDLHENTGWQNPDEGSRAAPVGLEGEQLPYTGEATGGISYYRIEGTEPFTARTITVTGLSEDADLFVLNDAGFREYACGSVRGGAAAERCTTALQGDQPLYIQVYSYEGAETGFTVDITYW